MDSLDHMALHVTKARQLNMCCVWSMWRQVACESVSKELLDIFNFALIWGK